MADISTELARILSAIYGEDVRGSIHDAIEKINDVSEVVLTTGTAVTSPSSSSTGFYDDSLYLNTDTFELWKCTGVNTWASQGILKGEAGDDGNGIVSIVKTSTSGLVDTYTITYTDGTTSTFNVTNGADGANGNKWYRGTGISGKAALPTVYTGSGVADANSGDMFLNPSEGAVYSCVTGGIPSVATWQYEMTLSGGGGGGAVDSVNGQTGIVTLGVDDLDDVSISSLGSQQTIVYDGTEWGNEALADVALSGSYNDLTNKPTIPTVDQTYSATSINAQSGKAVAQALSSYEQPLVKNAGSKTWNDLITNASTYLQSSNTNKFYRLSTAGAVTTANKSLFVDGIVEGAYFSVNSHIAVVEVIAGVYKYDYFGGGVSSLIDPVNRRTPQNITSRIQSDSGASLLNAIADQDLAKYGYSIGDYFESPTNRSLVTQTNSNGSVTTQTVNVKFKYYLADMDAWYGEYDSYAVVGTHHVELFVDCMIKRQWHSASDITNVGYDLSALYTYLKGSILDAIKADMKALFGGSTGLEHLLSHQLYLTKSFTACEWVSTYIHTPSEFEVYGGNAFSGNDAQKYAFNKKLALFDKFRFNQILRSGNSMWLYNMYSASSACLAYSGGIAYAYSPVTTYGAAGLILLH